MHPLLSDIGPLRNLTPSDRKSFLEFGFGPNVPVPFQCVHHAFDHHAASHPDNLAVVDFDVNITYSALAASSNSLACHLREVGVGRGSRVCLLMERSIPLVVAILATLKAGAAYVPLDGNIVSDKTLEHVLNDASPSAVLTMRKFSPRISSESTSVLYLDELSYDINDGVNVENHSTSEDSAYIIYTSGTTGVPKGVDVKHGNITNLLCLAPGNLGMRPGVRVSQLMNIGFDMAAWEILGSMCNGATLHLRGKTSKEWRAVMKIVDVVIGTPSMLLPHDPANYPNIRTIAVAGEPCSQGLADAWSHTAKFHNSCGPTEITIINTVHPHTTEQPLNIGKPTPNNSVYVLDEKMKPLPIGETGLMWAGGLGVSRGYLNLPEKTSERYRRDPFSNDGAFMFNTGDLGRWLPDGSLEHLGRIDDQVKVKGFRVELDGVAVAMQSHPEVKGAVALLIDGTLWGFVTPGNVDTDSVKEATGRIQPYYAVPTHIVALDVFPGTTNSKTDKRALRQIATDRVYAAKEIVATKPVEPRDITLPQAPPTVVVRMPSQSDASTVSHFSLVPTGASSSTSVSSSAQNDKISSTDEKCYPWEGHKDDEIPSKTQGKLTRNLRHQIFTLYRRLFSVVFITNMAIFVAIAIRGADAAKIGEIAIANLLCAILMRQDYVINAFFTVFCSVPSSWPLAIRRVCARVYHIGGLHSGCAVSGVVWLALFTGQATKQFVEHNKISTATLAITYFILMFLFGIVLFAHPALRQKSHDVFERVHRFLGWTAIALVWAQVVLLINDSRDRGITLSNAMVHSTSFWMVVVATVSIILPWLRLRKVPVRSEVLSPHAVRLYFDYVTPIPGSFTRISVDPLMEWHGFATIPEPGMKGYSLVVSKAGDWTSQRIAEAPSSIWVRGIPTCGVLRIVPLFRRLVFVATGSGIGPCAPCVLEQRVPIKLLWMSPNVRQTFGDKLVDQILGASPDAVVYDTRVHGKPDIVKLTYRLVKEFNAEAVCIISNQKLTRKVVYGMMSRGIPAFGAIWDS